MSANLPRLTWPATLVLWAAIIAAGVYFGAPAHRSSGPGACFAGAADAEAGASRTRINEDVTTVYVMRSGPCYHRARCPYLREAKTPMPLSRAKQRYSPCRWCNAPR